MRGRIAVGFLLAAALSVLPRVASAAPLDLAVESIDSAAYPAVSVTLMVPQEMSAPGETPSFSVAQNGVSVDSVDAVPVAATRSPLAVVLAIDESGSMSGEPMAEARRAAQRFIAMMGPQDRVAIVAFSTKARILAPLTSDKRVLRNALNDLLPSGETAVYDGLATAVSLLPKRGAQTRSVVLLSDGGDTVSRLTLTQATDEMLKASVPVFTIALWSPEADHSTLKMLSKVSRGRFTAIAAASSLSDIYTGLAEEMRSKYRLSFRAKGSSDKQLSFVVTVQKRGRVGRATVRLENPQPLPAPIGMLPWRMPQLPPAPIHLSVIAGLVFFTAALAVYAVLLSFRRSEATLEELRYYDQLHQGPEGADENGLKRAMEEAVGRLAERRGLTSMVQRRLVRAAVPMRAEEWIFFHAMTVVALGLALYLWTRQPLATFLAVLAGSVLPLYLVGMAGDRRKRHFEQQLPDVLAMIAGSLRAGYGVQQAIDLVSREMAEPAASEFRRVLTEVRLGISVDEALKRMSSRLESVDFRWTVTAINIQREVGGNLAEVLDNVAETVRERAALRRQVKSLTADGRISSYILIALPFLIAGSTYLLAPSYMNVLFSDSAGRMALGVILGMLLVGVLIMRKIVDIEV